MLGGAIKRPKSDDAVIVHHTEEVIVRAGTGNTVEVPMPKDHLTGVAYASITASEAHPIRLINLTKGTRTQLISGTYSEGCSITFTNPAMIDPEGNSHSEIVEAGDKLRVFWDELVTDSTNDAAIEVTISASTFPGTYKVVGDTFMRSYKTGADEAFQFVINKAKVSSEVTITLEAEGDPSTFEMTLTVLRDDDGNMMKLVRYSGASGGSDNSGNDNGSVTPKGQ